MPKTDARAGAGPYEQAATVARDMVGAEGVILIVYGDARGGGYEVLIPEDVRHQIPRILREMADAIQQQLGGGSG